MCDVSVVITCYNHEKYIEDCIKSVVCQKNINFEIVIGDDCSTDGTMRIIHDYKNKYPDIIHVINRDHNVGMQQNMKECFNTCKGEFIAICEGDDYWTSDRKLKIMYDIMINDKNCLMCFNDINIDCEGVINEHFTHEKEKLKDEIYVRDVLFPVNLIANFSCCMYRSDAVKNMSEVFYESKGADFLFNMFILDNGYGRYINEKLSSYRIHKSSQWSSLSEKSKAVNIIKMCFEYNHIFNNKYMDEFIDLSFNNIDKYIDDAISSYYNRKRPLKRLTRFFKKLKRFL